MIRQPGRGSMTVNGRSPLGSDACAASTVSINGADRPDACPTLACNDTVGIYLRGRCAGRQRANPSGHDETEPGSNSFDDKVADAGRVLAGEKLTCFKQYCQRECRRTADRRA